MPAAARSTRTAASKASTCRSPRRPTPTIKLTATNRGGHSSPPRPDNAIYALAGALKAIEAHRFQPMINDATRAYFESVADEDKGRYGELVRKWLKRPGGSETADLLEANDSGYTRTRCVATKLSGGHAPNALPQKAEANVNCRIFPGVKIETVRQQLQALAGPDVKVEIVDHIARNPTPARCAPTSSMPIRRRWRPASRMRRSFP